MAFLIMFNLRIIPLKIKVVDKCDAIVQWCVCVSVSVSVPPKIKGQYSVCVCACACACACACV